MKTMQVWPNPPGLTVPDPATNENIQPGQIVERSQFILRCLKSGDLVDEEPKIPAPPSAPKAEAAPELSTAHGTSVETGKPPEMDKPDVKKTSQKSGQKGGENK